MIKKIFLTAFTLTILLTLSLVTPPVSSQRPSSRTLGRRESSRKRCYGKKCDSGDEDYTKESKAELLKINEELLALSKERNELFMNIDMLKNDLDEVVDVEVLEEEKMRLKMERQKAELTQSLMTKNAYISKSINSGISKSLDTKISPSTVSAQIEDVNDKIVDVTAELEIIESSIDTLVRFKERVGESIEDNREGMGENGRKLGINLMGVD
jgi:DNA repair ATPase RecN